MNIQKFIQNCNCPLNGAPYKEMLDTNNIILINLLRRCLTMFHIENLPETINERVLMFSFWINESYGVLEYKGDLRNVWGGYAGKLDFYGYPTEYLWTTGTNSGTEKLDSGVVGHSNSLWTPIAPTLYYYSNILGNLDTSLKIASINTRIMPLYQATSDSERKQLDDVFNNIKKGEMSYTVLQKKTIEELVNGEGRIPIDLTGKSGDSNYIPMILQAYDNVLARVCREIGINITNVMKKAQVISPEVNGYENYTQIFLDDMLENITDAFSKVNEKWNKNWKVTLSNAFMDDNASMETAEESADSNGGSMSQNEDSEDERGKE